MSVIKAVPVAALLGLGTTLLLSQSAEAFTFVEIANTSTSDFTSIDNSAYGINDLGEVAFEAVLDGQSGIFAGDGGPVSTRVDPSEGFTNISFIDINSAGTIVFNETAVPGIFRVDGGVITPLITEASSLGQLGFTIGGGEPLSAPVINEAGAVAFLASNSDLMPNREGLFVIDGGVITTILDDTNVDIFRFALNNNGEVAFFGIENIISLTDDGDAVFLSDGVGGLVALPDPLGFGTVEGPTLNDDGTIAFDTLFVNDMGDADQGIFLQQGGTIDLIADLTGEFNAFQRPALNNQENLVFSASLDDGSNALFAGPDPVADRVIGIGDMLFGSTITSLNFTQQTGLNNQGQFAFTAGFEDGSVGLFRADPEDSDFQPVPEPISGIALLMIGTATVLKGRKSHKANSSKP